MKNVVAACTLFLSALIFPVAVFAQEPLYPERPTGFVNDQAGILGDATDLEKTLATFEKETSNEVAVLTIPTIGDVSIEEYALTIFEKWGIGKRENDNGVLLLIALDDREMRIEVGYGLEGALPDATAKSIITNEITPAFKDGRYYDGVNRGIVAITQATKGEYTPLESGSDSESNTAGLVGFAIFVVVFIVITVSSAVGSKKGGSGGKKSSSKNTDSWWNSGSSSGSSSSGSSFGGFSGGSSGGGGSSGSW